jgi:hypothetical protein
MPLPSHWPQTYLLATIIATLTLVAMTHVAQAEPATDVVARIDELGGQITKDTGGRIVEVNLANRPATDDDLRLLASLLQLDRLRLWGAGVTDEGIGFLHRSTSSRCWTCTIRP